MIYDKLFVPLGVDSTPIGQRKCIIPEIGAALVTGGASLLGSILGIGSQSSANSQNLQMMRETNQMNYKIADEQNRNSFNQFVQNLNWLKEQYYDTGQYERLVRSLGRAGLNPALALGSANPVGSVGQASPTQFHAAQMEAGHVDPLSFDGISEGVGSAVDAYFNNELKSSQSDNIRADTKTKDIQNLTQFSRDLAYLHNLWEDIQSKRSQRDLTEAQKKHYDMMSEELDGKINLFWTQFEALSDQPKKSNRLLDANYDEAKSRTTLNKIEAVFRPAVLSAGIRLSNAQSKSTIEHIRLIQPQIDSMVQEGKLTDAKSIGQYLMNGESAIKFLEDNHLYEMYNKNGLTKKGRDFFYMLGDVLSHGIIRNLPK